MITAVFCVLLLTGFVSIADWRFGMLACVVIGCASDPVRKVLPGQPIWMSGIVGVFFMLTLFGGMRRGMSASLRTLYSASPRLKNPLQVFVMLVVLYAIAAYLNTGILIVSLIGLLAYLSPVPALLMATMYGRSTTEVIRWARTYLYCVAAMGSGIFLSVAGVAGKLLDQMGSPLIAYDPISGVQLVLRPGFFRAPEIAGWHLATALCVALTLFMSQDRKSRLNIVSASLLGIGLLTAMLFTGRRKYLVEVLAFLVMYSVLTGVFRRRALRSVISIASLVGLALVALQLLPSGSFLPTLAPFVSRGISLQEGGMSRATGNSFEGFQYVIAENGWLGRGAGTGSQGIEYFVGQQGLVGLSAEGGFNKVLAELGVPGLLVFCWVLVAFARSLLGILQRSRSMNDKNAHVAIAFVSILAAQLPLFLIAHQVYGDVFVLLILGLLTGFVLANGRAQIHPSVSKQDLQQGRPIDRLPIRTHYSAGSRSAT